MQLQVSQVALLVSLRERLARESPPRREQPRAPAEASWTSWTLPELSGRLVELSAWDASAQLSVAFGLVLDAQRRGEPVAWIGGRESAFYPPDVAAGGVDLDALAVVRVPDGLGIARAADHLIRSGAFGLVLLDMGADARLSQAMQSRLIGLLHVHETAVLCLTRKPAGAPSLGSLVSLRGEARRVAHAPAHAAGELACELRVLKDKQRPPGSVSKEVCRGSAGLR